MILIQACRQSVDTIGVPDEDLAMTRSSAEKTHICMKRPHTVLLFASIGGEYAKEGAYTDAMAQQFHHADGRSDIHDMHAQAVLKIGDRGRDQQIPEFRSTLMYRLILLKPHYEVESESEGKSEPKGEVKSEPKGEVKSEPKREVKSKSLLRSVLNKLKR